MLFFQCCSYAVTFSYCYKCAVIDLVKQQCCKSFSQGCSDSASPAHCCSKASLFSQYCICAVFPSHCCSESSLFSQFSFSLLQWIIFIFAVLPFLLIAAVNHLYFRSTASVLSFLLIAAVNHLYFHSFPSHCCSESSLFSQCCLSFSLLQWRCFIFSALSA